jgi:hypothetical protein
VCGLCGILGDGSHWADGVTGPSAIPWLRREARRQRVALASAALRPFGLSLADWQGATFLLRNRTGATLPVATLADLWPKAERMAGRPLDPLDPQWLDALDGGG